MTLKHFASLAAAAALTTWTLCAQAVSYQVVDLTGPNHSLYDMTDGGSYPVAGDYSFGGIPYRIGAQDGNGFNIWHSAAVNQTTQVYELSVNVFGATEVYTVMNLWYGVAGHEAAKVEFFGSGGATYSKTLVVGVDLRDHYIPGYGALTGTDTTQIFANNGVRLDRQTFVLPGDFTSQTLQRIVVTGLTAPADGGLGQPFVAAVTIAAVPEPETYALFLFGLSLLGWRTRKSRD